MSTPNGFVASMASLRADTHGGTIALDAPDDVLQSAEPGYDAAIAELGQYKFWAKGGKAGYRPGRGLWLPQRRAIAFLHAYLSVCKTDPTMREAALVKMPTGTGKTAVIAAMACTSPLVEKTLILTPRAGLVDQMRLDLSFRFWGKRLGALYHHGHLEEGVARGRMKTLVDQIGDGTICPVRVLCADQYARIWEERDQGRQILIGTFNALHLILGLEPPPHRSMYGRKAREVAASLQAIGPDRFRKLLKEVDLVIVDEGHYEPAYSWSQAVRELGRPTAIFSATPYRNDYKYFKIDGHFVFNLSWKEAVQQRLIRAVECKPPVSGDAPRARGRGYDERSFVREFAATLKALPKGKKAIVRAATYQALTALQRAFMRAGTRTVLIHDAVARDNGAFPDLERMTAAHRKALELLRFEHVAEAVQSRAAQRAKVWLHQYKLLEGIDDDRFVEIWLYDGFGTARQVVQQVGRAIRRPHVKDPDGRIATIRGSSRRLDVYEGAPTVHKEMERRWEAYQEYEKYVANRVEAAFIAETQLIATIKRAAPAIQYIAGEFRAGHLLDEKPTMAAFMLPRRAVVCRVRKLRKGAKIPDEFLDELQDSAMEAMLLEERFEICKVAPAEDAAYHDVRLIRYLAWGNSPYLARHHIPEWRLGVMAIVRAGRYIFMLDTESLCLDYARAGLLSPESVELKRLFPRDESAKGAAAAPARAGTRIVETAAAGLDISELGLRAIRVRRHALEEGYFDLAEASQVPTSVQGYGRLGEDTARRRLSFSRSSVADATYGLLPVKDYVAWTRLIAAAMADRRIKPHVYFDRFAQEHRPPDSDGGVPRSILLDLWDILDVAGETRAERQWDQKAIEDILEYDTCYTVRPNEDEKGRYCFTFGKYTLELKYFYRDTIPPAGRYQIIGDELNDKIAKPDDAAEAAADSEPEDGSFGRRLPASLTRLINQEQAFRIIPATPDLVYSHGHFYKPDINAAVLSVLEPVPRLARVVSEKGDTRLKRVKAWDGGTLFGLVYGWAGGATYAKGNNFAADIAACKTVICDDRGKEIADFYGIDDEAKRVLIVHAKAEKPGSAGASARKLQEVARQAQASLAFAGSSRRPFPFPAEWRKNEWKVTLDMGKGPTIRKTRLVAGAGLSIKQAHDKLIKALANPSYTTEVIMLTSGILSKKAASKAFKIRSQGDLQFLYFLASVRSSFDRAGIRFRIICNP